MRGAATATRTAFGDALGAALESLFGPWSRSREVETRPVRPILLLHGLASSPRVMAPLESRLRRTLERPTLRLALGPGFGDIRDLSRVLGSVLSELARAPDFARADLVGHSLGGLVASYSLKVVDGGRTVRRVVTLAAPHGGVPRAFGAAFLLGCMVPSIGQMLEGSDFLAELAERPLPAGTSILSIAASRDLLVPPSSARLSERPGQRNALLAGANHWSLLFSRRAFSIVEDELAAPDLVELAPARGRSLELVSRAPLKRVRRLVYKMQRPRLPGASARARRGGASARRRLARRLHGPRRQALAEPQRSGACKT
jgi:pimeloyl-ACP methyl ester carboxylesterase